MSTPVALSLLETLPAEIHILLMHQLDSTRSLFSLLRASPIFLQTYRLNRNTIFPDVVCNHISTVLLPVALTTMRWRRETKSFNLDSFRQSIQHLEQGITESCVLSAEDARQLLKFHNLVQELSEDATTKSLGLLLSQLPSRSSDVLDAHLSPTEQFRVVRAFYHWEFKSPVCKHFLKAKDSHSPRMNDWMECFDRFLDTLTFHEVEEFCFVSIYLKGRLNKFVDQVEDDRWKKFIDRGPGHGRYDWELEDNMFFSSVLHAALDDWTSNFSYGESLTKLCKLFDMPTAEERLDYVERVHYLRGRNDIEGALNRHRVSLAPTLRSPLLPLDWHSPGPRLPRLDWNGCPYVETIDGASLGLLWACRESGRQRPNFDLLNKLVAPGLAIWDAKRLRNENVFSNDPWQIACQESFLANKRRGRSSIESRATSQEDRWEEEGILGQRSISEEEGISEEEEGIPEEEDISWTDDSSSWDSI